MSVATYRKKPVEIEAMQFDGTAASADAICRWANDQPTPQVYLDAAEAAGEEGVEGEALISYVTDDSLRAHDLAVETLEGTMTASDGDWIICGIAGEFYPCKPDIFEASYERVLDAGEHICEGCSIFLPVDTAYFDGEGVPLCGECWTDLLNEAEVDG